MPPVPGCGPSHWVIETAIAALARLTHRGAVGADGRTGDGCGLLMKQPEEFFRIEAAGLGLQLAQRFAVGMVFLNRDARVAGRTRNIITEAIQGTGLEVAGWREVPVEPSVCGEQALLTMPRIEQVFVNAPAGMQRGTFNRQLFLARRRAEKQFGDADPAAYVASLSSVTISYKGMFLPGALIQAGGAGLRISWSDWLAVGYYGIVVTVLAFLLWARGVARVPAGTAAAFTGLIPVSALALSALALGEAVTGGHLVAAALVVAGIVALARAS